MNDDFITHIQDFTLKARAALENEAAQQLEGIYGWLPDASFAKHSGYPAIAQLSEARETRHHLEQFAADEKSAGLAGTDARRKLIRETAFTWLNRFVAFRLMEERKLIKQSIVRLGQSNGFIFWLTLDDANKDAYALHQQGALPLNAMGEGPSDLAYRRFLLWQCGELARDVSILFDPYALASRLCPRPPVLKELVADMNAEALADAWKSGNEETLGWLYQAFNAKELQAAFTAARQSKKKFEADDIPAVTQLFTIRWVVRFLVENTLGRLWVEMHPDSRLKDKLGYLVPVQKANRPLKPAREITFLDPCCGSMHFGLVAFGLFAEMYHEEIVHAGEPGWPEKPSVAKEDEIAGSIVECNLFGIDIDLRAVQISALTLLLRARTQAPRCAFTDQNLACANVELITGGRLEEFVKQAKFSHPIYERILRALAAKLKDSNNLGSLLRLETVVGELIVEERRKAEFDKQFLLTFPGITSEQFKTREGIEEFFDILSIQVLRHLDQFVRDSREAGIDAAHFVNETSKGLRYLRLVQRRYDVVATNPPYLSARKMNKRLAVLMEEQYKAGKQDLYAAFILCCKELLAPQGLLGMLTMHSYMFIGSYEEMRDKLRDEVAIETLAHFGGGLFAVGNPGTLQTAAFVFRKEPDAQAREENRGAYFRLVRERDAEAKCIAFEAALTAFRSDQRHPCVFTCQQAGFDAIPGKPWVYWFSAKIRDLFRQHPLLGAVAPPKVGLQTGENVRFLRKWWEVGHQQISVNSSSCKASKKTGKAWFPYMKGGTPLSWFGNQEHVVNWKNDGEELYAFRPTSVIRNPTYYFRKGVTWSDVSSKGFAGRLSPGGFVHDVKGMTCYPPEESLWTVLGIFNSSFANFVLSALNPTISFQVGDIERLPLATSRNPAIDALVQEAVRLAKQPSAETETTYQFVSPPHDVTTIAEREQHLSRLESEIDDAVSRLYALGDEDLTLIRQELDVTPTTNEEAAGEESKEDDAETHDEEESASANWSKQSLAQAWISYAFGVVLGRYAIGKMDGLGRGKFDTPTVLAIRALIDRDGMMVPEKGHPQDIVRCTVKCLELMRGKETAYALIHTAADEDSSDPEDLVRGWLDRFTGQPAISFWKYHHQLYRKRPIYWPLQSPKKKFTVWVFHEQFTKDTLFKVRSEFVEPKIRLLKTRIKDFKDKAARSTGRERRSSEKEASQLEDLLDDVQALAQRLSGIIQRGYTPHIDDGVLLNAAPLWEILPAWPETRIAWEDLEAEEYDWAQQAMEYWPSRVKAKCKTNKSFAIAHGLA